MNIFYKNTKEVDMQMRRVWLSSHEILVLIPYTYIVKPVLSSHSKIDKKVLKTGGSLVRIKSIVEFCNTFDLHQATIGLENIFLSLLLSDHLGQVLL